MTSTPFRTDTGLGPDLTQVVKSDQVYYEGAGRLANGAGQIASPQLGVTAMSNDGRMAVWVEASATITVAAAPGTQLAVDADFTAAAGSEGYYAPNSGDYSGTIAAGDRFWAMIGTPPAD